METSDTPTTQVAAEPHALTDTVQIDELSHVHATDADKRLGDMLLRLSMRQSDPEVAASIVSEAIGRVINQLIEADEEGDKATSVILTKRPHQLVQIRDRVYAGDRDAIDGVLSRAWC